MPSLYWAADGTWGLTTVGDDFAGVGALALAGAFGDVDPDGHRALAWHVLFWNPWFLLWGVAWGLAWWWTRAASAPPPTSGGGAVDRDDACGEVAPLHLGPAGAADDRGERSLVGPGADGLGQIDVRLG